MPRTAALAPALTSRARVPLAGPLAQALQNFNIETIIVFRACCPLVVSMLDYVFLGRSLPSAPSLLCLVLLVAGAAGYVASDAQFALNGWAAYSWATTYFFIISVEMAYGKHVIGPAGHFKSMWGECNRLRHAFLQRKHPLR